MELALKKNPSWIFFAQNISFLWNLLICSFYFIPESYLPACRRQRLWPTETGRHGDFGKQIYCLR